jgi:hypothetical protein
MLEGMKRRRVYYRLQHHSSWLMDPFLGLLLLIDTDTTDVDTETDLAFAFRLSGFGAVWPPPAAGNFRLSAKVRRSPESSEFSC